MLMSPRPARRQPLSLNFLRNNTRQGVGITWRTLKLVWSSARYVTAALAATTLISALLPLAVAYTGKRIVDAVVGRSIPLTLHWVVIELMLVASLSLTLRTQAFLRQLLGARLSMDVNVSILSKAVSLELRHFEDGKFYDSLTRARREASFRPLSVVSGGLQLLQSAVTLLGYLVLITHYSVWAALALFAAAVPAAAVEMYFSRTAFRLRNMRSPDARKLNYLEYVLANDQHAKEVQLFGLGEALLDRYSGLAERLYREDRSLARKRYAWALLLSLIATGAFYVCYGSMTVSAATREITLGTMSLYVIAFRQGQQSFQSLLSALSSMYEDTLYMSNLFEYLAVDIDHSVTSRSPISPALPSPRAERGIRFERVSFKYPSALTNGKTDWALRDVSFFVPPGQSIAVVGRNGAGKTTLIKLLARLYDPSEGRILLDDVDLRHWDVEALRRRFAVIFQDFNHYQFDVRDNIGLGSLAHLGEEERIVRAAAQGGADALVKMLPDGLETKLGKWAHDGIELSGGQWQKLALSRAFMREEADMLVLDEPTAALDAETEHAMFERLRTLANGRTTFLISHRFSTVRRADRILVIEGGRLVEDGAHEQLMHAGALYSHLFSLQAEGYA